MNQSGQTLGTYIQLFALETSFENRTFVFAASAEFADCVGFVGIIITH